LKALHSQLLLVLRLTFLLGIFSLMSGCATKSLEAQVADNVNLKGLKTFYVKKLPADGRGIEKLIADELNSLGFKATSGADDPSVEDYDALITYQDKWMWDITMYMMELLLQVKEPKTNFVMASGHSFRNSFARESQEKMVAEVLGEVFK